MNIRCPKCQTVFRVDPARIPASGARARCARCSATFMVRRPPAQPATPVGAQTPPQATSQRPPESPPPPTPAATPRAPAATPAAGASPEAPAATVPGRSPAETGTGPSPFLNRNPDERAERLARALVSDIVAYYPDRRERSLAEGTLRTEFRDEIMKSWEEYVAQVGDGVARSTPFFRDALNAILADGQELF